MSETITKEQYFNTARERFGDDAATWRFVCPSCGHIASVSDWRKVGASEGEIAFSCVGRHMGAGGEKAFKQSGGPCNYTGGGLFRLNPVRVLFDDGSVSEFFEIAAADA